MEKDEPWGPKHLLIQLLILFGDSLIIASCLVLGVWYFISLFSVILCYVCHNHPEVIKLERVCTEHH